MFQFNRKSKRTFSQFVQAAQSALKAGDQRGMTLIEIMIVIAIIAGLMAVLGANVMGKMKEAKVKNTKIQMQEIGKQLDAYNLNCGSYPTTEQGLKALVQDPGKDACPNWGEPAFKKEPKDGWNTPFIYESDGSKYVLKSLGADRKDGGDGFNSDISSEEL